MSFKNTKSRENSEFTKKTATIINNEITTQVTSKLDQIREDSNTQILEVINSPIAEKVLPAFKHVLGVQKMGLNTTRDHQSGRPNRSLEDYSSQMDHMSGGLVEVPRDHFSHVDYRSRRLVEGPRDHSVQMDHRSGRRDGNQGGSFGQQDKQDRSKLISEFTSHEGLNREISMDSQADD